MSHFIQDRPLSLQPCRIYITYIFCSAFYTYFVKTGVYSIPNVFNVKSEAMELYQKLQLKSQRKPASFVWIRIHINEGDTDPVKLIQIVEK